MIAWCAVINVFAKNSIIRPKYLLRCPVILSKIGSPDLVVLFTSTVSHSMVRCALKEAQRKNVDIVRSHTSSSSALKTILAARTEEAVV